MTRLPLRLRPDPRRVVAPVYERELFRGKLGELGHAGESASFVLESLPARFTPAQLDRALADLEAQIVTHSSVDPFRRRPAMPISVL